MTPEEILTKENINYIFQGRDMLVSCLSPDHEDNHPSMRVDRTTGVFNCLSCGFKGSVYTKYQVARDIQMEVLGRVKEKLHDIMVSTSGLKIPEGSVPYSRAVFKGIPREKLAEYGAFTNDAIYPDRIVFPIKDAVGRIIAFNGRSLYSELPPKYKVYPPAAKVGMYPPIITPRESSMILVEGLFDIINLKYHGGDNVVCAFGTKKLTAKNIVEKLTPYRLQGVQKIHIMFDGDKAGYTAAKSLEYLLSEHTDFVTNIISLNEDDDPGCLTADQINEIYNEIYRTKTLWT